MRTSKLSVLKCIRRLIKNVTDEELTYAKPDFITDFHQIIYNYLDNKFNK